MKYTIECTDDEFIFIVDAVQKRNGRYQEILDNPDLLDPEITCPPAFWDEVKHQFAIGTNLFDKLIHIHTTRRKTS